MPGAMLRFATFTSDIELSFYASLASHKINHDKLDDSARRVLGVYEIRPSESPAASCRMQLRGNALTSNEISLNCYRAEGTIKNYNTIEEYRASDKASILDRAARTIWDAIGDGTIFSCPSLLASFSVLCFSDLKKYKFTYLFGYPALHSEPSWTTLEQQRSDNTITGHLTSDESVNLVETIQTWRYSVDVRQWGFFLAKKVPVASNQLTNNSVSPSDISSLGKTLDGVWEIGSLGEYEQGFFDGVSSSDRFFCFADPSTYEEYPGWPLRNLLALARKRWNLTRLQILCYRDTHNRRHEARSIILHVQCDESLDIGDLKMPKVTGWERGPSGKVVSKVANLGEYMDPARLADQAVDLNLKLIKWRIAPSLDLDIIKETKCLLLGAGTLGSYVSRNLMGWGVRKITFVDSGNVSFSNPVRQPLFNFEDCLGGGAPKAERAAAALKEIYPGVDATGWNVSVPMAGHPIVDKEKTRMDYQKLRELFSDHDAIFLLMDTRESRWLPTVMGKSMGKLVMNAALGFDSYVIMRHGTVSSEYGPGDELGCYFCNDVVAPADSMSDRTLDQQCTVTRPGIAAIASAMLVELMVSVLQEKSQESVDTTGQNENPLGGVPHTIRGFLSQWNTLNITGKSYSQCSACSQTILQAYREGGWEFVERALNEGGYVAELSGLAELQRQAELAAADLDWDEDEQADLNEIEEEGELL